MNYLAHAYRFLDNPYFIAGTGLPDWMSVIDRKNRARRQYAQPLTDDSDPAVAAVARGCVQHHDDDRWFHQNESFVRLSTEFAVQLREQLDPGMGHQAGFVGHITVELLLDAILSERDATLIDRYYAQLAALDPQKVQFAAGLICRKPVNQIVELLPRFIDARFLEHYHAEELLLRSLNGVMRRIQLPQLPPGVTSWLASARLRVRVAADELLRPG